MPPLPARHRWMLLALMVGNAVVWLGQVWPAGAPPFARPVNIAVLSATLVYLGLRWRGRV